MNELMKNRVLSWRPFFRISDLAPRPSTLRSSTTENGSFGCRPSDFRASDLGLLFGALPTALEPQHAHRVAGEHVMHTLFFAFHHLGDRGDLIGLIERILILRLIGG